MKLGDCCSVELYLHVPKGSRVSVRGERGGTHTHIHIMTGGITLCSKQG